MEPHQHATSINLKALDQLCDARRNSTNGLDSIYRGVAHLLTARCPSHVARLIIAFWIRIAVNFTSWRTLAVIGQKFLVRIEPRLIHCNSFTAVVLPILMIWIGASTFHAAPNSISASALFWPAMPVFEMSCITIHARPADARSETAVLHFKLPIASGTQAQTIGDGFSARLCAGWRIGENSPLAKWESNERDSFRHDVCLSQLTLCKWRHPARTGCRCDLTI